MVVDVQMANRTWDSAQLLTEPGLSLLQKILLSTDGTLTDLLTLYSGGPIRARKLGQSLTGEPPNRVLNRQVVLEGADNKPYVYANSRFHFDAFTRATQHALIESDTPIGILWQRERLEMYREIVERRSQCNKKIAAICAVESETPILSRTYRIHHSAAVIGEITEYFALTMFREM